MASLVLLDQRGQQGQRVDLPEPLAQKAPLELQGYKAIKDQLAQLELATIQCGRCLPNMALASLLNGMGVFTFPCKI